MSNIISSYFRFYPMIGTDEHRFSVQIFELNSIGTKEKQKRVRIQ